MATKAALIGRSAGRGHQTCFVNRVSSLTGLAGDVNAIDGKTPRRACTQARLKGAIHMISAFGAGASASCIATGDVDWLKERHGWAGPEQHRRLRPRRANFCRTALQL